MQQTSRSTIKINLIMRTAEPTSFCNKKLEGDTGKTSSPARAAISLSILARGREAIIPNSAKGVVVKI